MFKHFEPRSSETNIFGKVNIFSSAMEQKFYKPGLTATFAL